MQHIEGGEPINRGDCRALRKRKSQYKIELHTSELLLVKGNTH